MKTFLIPTDFSENSQNAIHYALHLNKKMNAEVVLFHSYVIPVYATDVPLPLVNEDKLRKESLKQLEDLKAKLQPAFPDAILNIKLSTSQGFAEDGIIGAAKKEKSDLIVMGTKGAGGLREVFIGSVTANVMEHIQTPVLIIPEKAMFKEIRKIIFATDYEKNDFENISSVVDFAKHFNAEIILLHVATGELDRAFETNAIQNFKEHIEKETEYDKVSYKLIRNNNASEGLNLYLEQENADLLAMTTKHRTFFQKIFNRSLVKEMAYHSHIPLIVFH